METGVCEDATGRRFIYRVHIPAVRFGLRDIPVALWDVERGVLGATTFDQFHQRYRIVKPLRVEKVG